MFAKVPAYILVSAMEAIKWMRRQGVPGTITVGALLTIASLWFFFTNYKGMDQLVLNVDVVQRPWSVITYPFALMELGGPMVLVWSILALLWLFLVGGSVERDLGTKGFVAIWFIATLLSAAAFYAGWMTLRSGSGLMGPFMPVATISIIWAVRNSETLFALLFMPVKAKWIGAIVAAGVFFNYGQGLPLLGFFALIPLLIAFLYASDRIPGLRYTKAVVRDKPTKAQIEREQRELAEISRRRVERMEKDRLKELFERSGIEDKD